MPPGLTVDGLAASAVCILKVTTLAHELRAAAATASSELRAACRTQPAHRASCSRLAGWQAEARSTPQRGRLPKGVCRWWHQLMHQQPNPVAPLPSPGE